jgi:hypothetical protein
MAKYIRIPSNKNLSNMPTKQSTPRGFIIFSASIIVVIGILCIINYSISSTLNWSIYPISALFMVWFVVAPAIGLPRYKLLGSYIGLSITLVPFLYIVAYLSSDGEWFWPLAFPLGLCLLGSIGIFFILITQLNNKWYLVAAAFFLFGVLLNFISAAIISHYLGEQNIPEQMINHITIAVCLLASLLFVLIGFQKTKKSK